MILLPNVITRIQDCINAYLMNNVHMTAWHNLTNSLAVLSGELCQINNTVLLSPSITYLNNCGGEYLAERKKKY